MRWLPASVQAYRKTPVFTETTIPAGLLRDHSTKPGTWGLIHVISGDLRLHFAEDGAAERLAPGRPGVLPPEALHRVAADGPVRFFVEFFREP